MKAGNSEAVAEGGGGASGGLSLRQNYRYFPLADAGVNPGGTLAHGEPLAAKS
jgi:hypothetical protein